MGERGGQKAEYRSAIRSRRMIREAFMELLREKDLTRITVTDIVRRADINRSTFYAHYPDVSGLMEEIEDEVIAAMLAILKDFRFESFLANPMPLLLRVNEFLEEDEDFYRQLLGTTGASSFLEKLKALFADYMEADEEIPAEVRSTTGFSVRMHYFAGGIVNLYQQWFAGTLDCELDDIPQEVAKLVTIPWV